MAHGTVSHMRFLETSEKTVKSIGIVDPEDLVAVGLRLSMLAVVRQIGTTILLIAAGFALFLHSWMAFVVGAGGATLVLASLSYLCANRVERITGLVRRDQRDAWARYREDRAYAASIDQALREGALARATRELSRPFDARAEPGERMNPRMARE